VNRREIKRRIYLTNGPPGRGYEVRCDMPGHALFFFCTVKNTKIGNAIVRALRELAYQENSK
jgi:hypothetical protein